MEFMQKDIPFMKLLYWCVKNMLKGIIYSLLDKKEEAAKQFETYQALVPEEFPQRGFLDDITLAAKGTPPVQFQKEFRNQFSDQK